MDSRFMNWLFGFVVLLLAAFGLSQWLHFSLGSFMDWVVGGSIFIWLLIIVTVPWNIHFKAKKVLIEAEISQERGIPLDRKQLDYAKTLADRSLIAAIALHGISALVLYILAASGISSIGYFGAIAALLLTILRPAISTYEYLASRLAMISAQIVYPREDVMELRSRFANLEGAVQRLEEQLNEEQPYSWAAKQQQHWEETRKDVARLSAIFEELRAVNNQDHERLSREAQQAIAQLSSDGQFLDHVREIIRFFKTS
ncbi:hypothetical protein TUMEXPCC7403_23180 [Tumidithrix helvetica PCC 7403]